MHRCHFSNWTTPNDLYLFVKLWYNLYNPRNLILNKTVCLCLKSHSAVRLCTQPAKIISAEKWLHTKKNRTQCSLPVTEVFPNSCAVLRLYKSYNTRNKNFPTANLESRVNFAAYLLSVGGSHGVQTVQAPHRKAPADHLKPITLLFITNHSWHQPLTSLFWPHTQLLSCISSKCEHLF